MLRVCRKVPRQNRITTSPLGPLLRNSKKFVHENKSLENRKQLARLLLLSWESAKERGEP